MAGLSDGPIQATVEGSFDGAGVALVSVRGDLDLATVPGVEAELEVFVQAATDRLVLDMSGVTFMDSSGVAMLLRAAGRVAYIEVREPSPPVLLVLRATGLSEVLHVEP